MKLVTILVWAVASLSLTKTNRQLFDDFHTIYEKADFKAMDSLLSPGFVGLDEKGEVSFRRPEYLAYMAEWNQVFKTKWNVVSVEEVNGTIKSIEYDTDMFNDYFYGKKREVIYIYTFSNNKIKSIQTITTNEGKKSEAVFEERFGKFYAWVSRTYPDKLKFCTSYDKTSALEVKKLLENYLGIVNKRV